MLIDVVQAMQNPQAIVPTFVWFEAGEFIHRKDAEPLDLSCDSFCGVSIIGSAFEYGERSLSVGFSSSAPDHCVCQMIERGSKVLNSIPSSEKGLDRDWSHVFYKIVDISRLWIAFGSRSIWVGIPTGTPEGIKGFDVLIGPINLR